MSKIYFYLLLLLSIIFYSPLQAQDTTKHIRNEIAIDVSPVFAGLVSRNSIPGITYRRHYEKGAFRVRFNFSGSNSEGSNVSSSSTHNTPARSNKNTDASLRIGYQWHKNFNKLRWYYGIDALAAYGKNTDWNTNTTVYEQEMSTYINTNQNKNTSESIGISPVIGLNYRINSRFSVSVESAIMLSRVYGKSKNTSTYVRQVSNQSTTQSESNSSDKYTSMNYYFIPMNGLLVSYHF